MKKIILGALLLSISMYAEVVSKELAYKAGEQAALVPNMNPNSTYEQRVEHCQKFIPEHLMPTADNRKEIMPFIINGCLNSIKK